MIAVLLWPLALVAWLLDQLVGSYLDLPTGQFEIAIEYSSTGAVVTRLYWRLQPREDEVEAPEVESSVLGDVLEGSRGPIRPLIGTSASTRRYRDSTFEWTLDRSMTCSPSPIPSTTTPSASTSSGRTNSSMEVSSLPTPPSLPRARARPVAAPRTFTRSSDGRFRGRSTTTLCIPEQNLDAVHNALEGVLGGGVDTLALPLPDLSADPEGASSTLEAPPTASPLDSATSTARYPTARLQTSSGWVDVYARPLELVATNTARLASLPSWLSSRPRWPSSRLSRRLSRSTPIVVANADRGEVCMDCFHLDIV